jgi:hypothetical protein
MTALVPKPVILRVVRSIERVKKGLETSDGGSLREVVCGHIGGRYFTLNSGTSRGVGFRSSADRSVV